MKLLALDIENTHTAIGVFDGDRLARHWRISTQWERTPDEYLLVLGGLLGPAEVTVDGVALAAVVPSAGAAARTAVAELVSGPILTVGPGIKTGLPMAVDHPREVGADRVVNAVAAKERYGFPVIVVDFGTATTIDVVGEDGSYQGGAIAPGLEVSMDALVEATAALRRVDLVPPRSVIGRTTVEAMQSGLLFGYAGMVDGIVRRMVAALPGGAAARVATGAAAESLIPLCSEVETVDEFLTLEGLRLVYQRSYPEDRLVR